MPLNLRAKQQPLKERYRADPSTALITLTARGSQTGTPLSCSVDIGRAMYEAQAHAGTGGKGTGPCSGDLLLGALAACAQVTTQMVAEAMGIATEKIAVTVTGQLDLKGTMGISRQAPVGFSAIRAEIEIVAPTASAEQMAQLREKAERYCVVLATLRTPPTIETTFV